MAPSRVFLAAALLVPRLSAAADFVLIGRRRQAVLQHEDHLGERHPRAGCFERRLPRGKDECWTILAAEPGAYLADVFEEGGRDIARRVNANRLNGVDGEMLEWLHAHAYGAEFDGADGFLDSATVGLPPRFVADGLRALSEDLRDSRREEIRQTATRRRAAMLVPTIAVLAPVMLLFIAAPLPSIVFGSR